GGVADGLAEVDDADPLDAVGGELRGVGRHAAVHDDDVLRQLTGGTARRETGAVLYLLTEKDLQLRHVRSDPAELDRGGVLGGMQRVRQPLRPVPVPEVLL